VSPPVYTVRVIDSPANVPSTLISPVSDLEQYVVSSIVATSQPAEPLFVPFSSECGIANTTTLVEIWGLPPIPPIELTLHWSGRYVLKNGEELLIECPGWDVAVTAYALTLP
jgi:hypothetical protein